MERAMSECSCFKCRAACKGMPGWFLPSEAEKAAELKGMSLRKFFKRFLQVNWGMLPEDNENTFTLSPAIERGKTGEEAPGDPRGRCIFLDKNEQCSIYEARPHECREYTHTDLHSATEARKRIIIEAWKAHQDQIKELLGRDKPRTRPFDDAFRKLGRRR